MIRSMTGYGQGAAEAPGLKATVELRSVNNRFADLKLRLPDSLVAQESALRGKVLATVKRGRVDLDLRLERTGPGAGLVLNRAVVDAVLAAWKTLRDDYGIQGEWDLPSLMRVPGLFEAAGKGAALDDDARAAVDRALDHALAALDAERVREGGRLQADLIQRVATMSGVVGTIRDRAATVPDAIRAKLIDRVSALAGQVPLDPARVAQEVAFLADRSDLTEEIVRLEGHLDQARSLLESVDGEPVGKRMDFLLQEIHRETNTIASKSQDLEISRSALTLKAEAEKIREQVQNLE
jgi:uncharacterized protein (TIGR00255 family)